MRFLVTCLFLIVCHCNLFSQQSVNFVSATPFYYKAHYPEHKPLIYRLDQGSRSIDTVQVLSQRDSCNLAFLNVYEEQGLMFMYEEGIYPNNNNYLTVVNLQSSTTMSSRKLDFGTSSCRQAQFLILPNGKLVYCLHFGGVGYYAYDRELNQTRFSPDILNHSFISGSRGTAINRTEWLSLIREEDKLIINTRKYDFEGDLALDEQPNNNLFKSWGTYRYYLTLAVKTNRIVAIVTNNSVPDAEKTGRIGYFIKSKINDEWFYREFKGGETGVVAFGPWLAGKVSDYNEGTYYMERGNPIRYNFKKISPGIENRRPLFASMEEEEHLQHESENFDGRAGWFGSYYPGVLFLFNVDTKSYFEWETHQGDSEILLVKEDHVYYRVDDEIFEAVIIDNGRNLSEPRSLIRDDRVRDIHWAFIQD